MARAIFTIDTNDAAPTVDLRTTKLTMDNVAAFGQKGDFLALEVNTFEYNADGTIEYNVD